MNIPIRNETIYQIIYSGMTQERKTKTIQEFGYYNIFISIPEKEDDFCK